MRQIGAVLGAAVIGPRTPVAGILLLRWSHYSRHFGLNSYLRFLHAIEKRSSFTFPLVKALFLNLSACLPSTNKFSGRPRGIWRPFNIAKTDSKPNRFPLSLTRFHLTQTLHHSTRKTVEPKLDSTLRSASKPSQQLHFPLSIAARQSIIILEVLSPPKPRPQRFRGICNTPVFNSPLISNSM